MSDSKDITIEVAEYDEDVQATGRISVATLSIEEITKLIDRARRVDLAARMFDDNPNMASYTDDLNAELEAAGIANDWPVAVTP
jgi:hypothetical protein